jgi:hypothetical protein
MVPGVFTIDEDNYLVSVLGLRVGRLTVPGTEAAIPSKELLYFDPSPRVRPVGVVPVASNVPPLYSVLAFPFSFFGWRGLVALNVLAFLTCSWLVFRHTLRHAASRWAPWLALGAFALGSYNVEYAQGLWPHMLSTALAFGALEFAERTRTEQGDPRWAVLAGLLGGVAAGVRYQNIVFSVCVGAGIVIWSRRRVVAAGLFAAGLAVPLAVSSVINRLRLGVWSPTSKSAVYLKPGVGSGMNPLLEAAIVIWSRVVDYTAERVPPTSMHDVESFMVPNGRTGAFLFAGVPKKAWLQSAPWIAIPLLQLALAWRRPVAGELVSPNRTVALRTHALVIAGMLLTFAVAGLGRGDNLCFNQRYLLELVPLMAVGLAWSVAPEDLRPLPLAMGVATGVAAAYSVMLLPWSSEGRQLLLLKVPIAVGGMLGLVWLLRRARQRRVLAILLGVALGWAMAVHLFDDLAGSRRYRSGNQRKAQALAALLTRQPGALFAYWGSKDAFGSLQLDHDLIIVDTWIDHGQDGRRLVDHFLRTGRRVLVLAGNMPRGVLRPMSAGLRGRVLQRQPFVVVELVR